MSIAIVLAAVAAMSAAPATAAETSGNPGKKICRKMPETGSLVKAQKICRTAKEWQAQQEAGREAVRDFQNTRRSASNN
jgi:hypothetical protein